MNSEYRVYRSGALSTEAMQEIIDKQQHWADEGRKRQSPAMMVPVYEMDVILDALRQARNTRDIALRRLAGEIV